MPLPVIADVYRCAIELSSFNGCTPANIFHVFRTTSSAPSIAADVEASIPATHPWSYVSEDFSAMQLTVTPLNGTSASVTVPCSAGGGTQSGQTLFEAAAILAYSTEQRGPRGRGRMFIGPLTEDSVNEAVVNAGTVSGILDAFVTFFENLSTEGIVFGVASYVHSDFHAVQAYSAKGFQSTQVRRLKATR